MSKILKKCYLFLCKSQFFKYCKESVTMSSRDRPLPSMKRSLCWLSDLYLTFDLRDVRLWPQRCGTGRLTQLVWTHTSTQSIRVAHIRMINDIKLLNIYITMFATKEHVLMIFRLVLITLFIFLWSFEQMHEHYPNNHPYLKW